MKQTVAYLGRPTVDHREIISATVRPGPLPIHTAGDIPALIGTADVTIDGDVVWADPTFHLDEPDWDLWCMTVQLDQADIAYNNPCDQTD